MKLICTERRCDWRGNVDGVLRAPDPFNPGVDIIGCPDCKAHSSIHMACDEPGCWSVADCGTPTSDGYRETCGEHMPES